VQDSDAAAAVDPAYVQRLIDSEEDPPPQFAMFAPLWKNTSAGAAGLTLGQGLTIDALMQSKSADDAQKAQQTLQALTLLARNLLGQQRERLEELPGDLRPAVQEAASLADALLAAAAVEQKGSDVRLRAHVEQDGTEALFGLIVPMIAKARQSAQQMASSNNLKSIGLAMHNYYSAYGRFPPAVVLGPDGKTPHSWRIALLPFLEENVLYNQYRLDEPWDSEHNKKLLSQMPDVFRHPQDAAGSTSAAYYLLTGPAALFSAQPGAPREGGPSIAAIQDGTSNTLMAVEAKRNIPWTKPEDIPYDASQALPKFGGYQEAGWMAAFADASCRLIPKTVEDRTVRAMITPSGLESFEAP
jgi:hypothetical protein